MRRFDAESGSTVLEMLTTILIMGILTAIALPAMSYWKGIDYDREVVMSVQSLSMKTEKPNRGVITQVEETGYQFAPEGVVLAIRADRSGICVTGWHENGNAYDSEDTALVAFNGRINVDCPETLTP